LFDAIMTDEKVSRKSLKPSKLDQRSALIRELIATEENYIEDLKVIIQVRFILCEHFVCVVITDLKL
jgi:hypothetical protein